MKPLPRLVRIKACESGEAQACVWCVYWQWYHCWDKRRTTTASLKPNSCACDLRKPCRQQVKKCTNMKKPTWCVGTEAFACIVTLSQDVKCRPQLRTSGAPQLQQPLHLETQDVNWFWDVHMQKGLRLWENPTINMQLTYPPKVFPVCVSQKGFVEVALSHQWAKACPFGNQFSAGHSEHLWAGWKQPMNTTEAACELVSWVACSHSISILVPQFWSEKDLTILREIIFQWNLHECDQLSPLFLHTLNIS